MQSIARIAGQNSLNKVVRGILLRNTKEYFEKLLLDESRSEKQILSIGT